MRGQRAVRLSKTLSRYLRHQPQALGLTLEPGGWVSVEALLAALARQGAALSRAELAEIVASSDKQRFSFDDTGTRVRANQGHSVPVDLQLEPLWPPGVLYHGTGERFLPAILSEGLRPMRRHHVHLSADEETARRVGARRGVPVVLRVEAGRLAEKGGVFYRSANGVWLTDEVPPDFLSRLP